MSFSIQTVLRSALPPGPQGPQGPGAVSVYANDVIAYANANLNFNNTATMNVAVSANTINKRANIELTANLTAIGIPSINANIANANSYASNLVAVYANSTLRYANANINFNNTVTLNVSVTPNTTNKSANVDLTVNTSLFSNSTGAAFIGSIQTGTNAASRTVQSKLRDFVNVTDFGADPTGTTDSTSAIQSAINAHNSIYIPPGTYLITAPIDLPATNNIEIRGVRGKSILMGSGSSAIGGIFRIPSAFYAENCTIYGVTFDSDDYTKDRWGIGTSAAGTATNNIYLSHWSIVECDFNRGLSYGIRANMIACTVYRCRFGIFGSPSASNLKPIESLGYIDATNPPTSYANSLTTNINVIEKCWIAKCGGWTGGGTAPTYMVHFENGYKLIFRDNVFEYLTPTTAVILAKGIFYISLEKCWLEDAQGSTAGSGKSIISVDVDAVLGQFTPVLVVNECHIHTGVSSGYHPDGLLNFNSSPRQVAQFSKNLIASLRCPITVGGTSNANYVSSFGNYATVGSGGDATGLNFDDPAKFDLGIMTTTVNATALLTRSGINVSAQAASAYSQANNAYNQANNAYDQANNAYTAANNRVLRTGDTLSGFLAVSKDNATTTMDSSGGYGIIEMGGNTGAYIDMKSPYSDDYDFRIITTTSGTQFLAGATMTFSGANIVFSSGVGLTATQLYSTTVGATNRDLYVDDTGVVGYVSSIRDSKANIEPIVDTNWLLQLDPVKFNRRKKDWLGAYTEDTYLETEYGLIAEDTEAVAPDLCFYDTVEDKKELRGVHYHKLITPMLRLLQIQQQKIDNLESEIRSLRESG